MLEDAYNVKVQVDLSKCVFHKADSGPGYTDQDDDDNSDDDDDSDNDSDFFSSEDDAPKPVTKITEEKLPAIATAVPA